jgi:hypothetical protein
MSVMGYAIDICPLKRNSSATGQKIYTKSIEVAAPNSLTRNNPKLYFRSCPDLKAGDVRNGCCAGARSLPVMRHPLFSIIIPMPRPALSAGFSHPAIMDFRMRHDKKMSA